MSELLVLINNISPSLASSIANAEVPQSSLLVLQVVILPQTLNLLIGFNSLITPDLLEIPLYASEIWQVETPSSKDFKLI